MASYIYTSCALTHPIMATGISLWIILAPCCCSAVTSALASLNPIQGRGQTHKSLPSLAGMASHPSVVIYEGTLGP